MPRVPGVNRYIREEGATRREMRRVQRSHAYKERATRQKVRAMPVQLLADMQVVIAAHRVPARRLQAHHQPGAVARHAARAHAAGHVPRRVRALPGHILVPVAEERAGAVSALPQGVVGGPAHGAPARRHLRRAGARRAGRRARRHPGHARRRQKPRHRRVCSLRRRFPSRAPPFQSSRVLLRHESQHHRGPHVELALSVMNL